MATLQEQLSGRYAIDRLLGRGGMGAVYLAHDLRLDRPVALKVLPSEFASQSTLRDRFVRETRTAASFSHPNIVPVFSIEEQDDLLAFAMGYVEGESLAELVARAGPLPVRDCVRLLLDVAYALAYAHGRGVVHRDIKPDNIMIERATGRALVMDFGISRTIETAATLPGLTRVGEVVGTPEYMSPEQASGDAVDGRSDLYALGLVAWFALTADVAMRGDNTQQVLVKQLTESLPPVMTVRTDVPAALSEAIARCVAKAPEARYAQAAVLIEALEGSTLRPADVPLPIRLFAQEAAQAGMILVSALLVAPLLLTVIRAEFTGDLDVVLPMVLFAAVIWGRMTVTAHQARRLATRGFTVAEIQEGFRTIRAEREAEREQLRADPQAVAQRRRHVLLFAGALVASYALQRWVRATMRTEVSPGWYSVSNAGVLILVAAYVMRGLSVVGLVRSPLRAPLGDRLFSAFWGGAPGRLILRAAQRDRSAPVVQGAAASKPVIAATDLERRVAALERWRNEQRA